MPAAIPLIVMGVSAAASVYGAKKAADASKQASQVQVDASNKAMDYQKESQAKAMAYAEQMRTQPLQPMQGPAQSLLSRRMGIPNQGGYGGLMSPPAQGGYQMRPQQPQDGGYRTLLGGQAPQSGGGVVLLQAPTGEQKAVPEAQAAALIAKGARRVG